MAVAKLTQLLSEAVEGQFAVGAFSVSSMEMAMGVVEAAEQYQSPIILQIAECRLDGSPLHLIGPVMRKLAERASIPVCVHLDHGLTIGTIREAMSLGFTSVMFDGSHLPLEENMEMTRLVCEEAHSLSVDCEGEIGQVGGSEDGETDIRMHLTSVEEALRFQQATRVDALAVAIGNAHGNYMKRPQLQFDRLQQIREVVGVPLVLHGGSGIEVEDYQKAIQLGIRKVNIATALVNRVLHGMIDLIDRNRDVGYTQWQKEIVRLSAHCAAEHIQWFGSAGKAHEISNTGSDAKWQL